MLLQTGPWRSLRLRKGQLWGKCLSPIQAAHLIRETYLCTELINKLYSKVTNRFGSKNFRFELHLIIC